MKRTSETKTLMREKLDMKRVLFFEPWFFLFFGVFHLHRIWGLIDRHSYARFWLEVMESRNLFYYFLMGFLSICVFSESSPFFKIEAITIGGGGSICLAADTFCLTFLPLLPD